MWRVPPSLVAKLFARLRKVDIQISRMARKPIDIPKGVDVSLSGKKVVVKGPKGQLDLQLNDEITLNVASSVATVVAEKSTKRTLAFAGTTRAHVANMVQGVSEGFKKELELVGVGYRAQSQGKKLNLSLGFSHPVEYVLPTDVNAETPTQTTIVITGVDKQKVGQVAAEIRHFRPPEPYKGKGVKYSDEIIQRKEAKKK